MLDLNHRSICSQKSPLALVFFYQIFQYQNISISSSFSNQIQTYRPNYPVPQGRQLKYEDIENSALYNANLNRESLQEAIDKIEEKQPDAFSEWVTLANPTAPKLQPDEPQKKKTELPKIEPDLIEDEEIELDPIKVEVKPHPPNKKPITQILNLQEIDHTASIHQQMEQERANNQIKLKQSTNKYKLMDPLLHLPTIPTDLEIPEIEKEHPMKNFYQRRDYPELISADNFCSSDGFPDPTKKVNLVMAIKSGCKNKERRDAIRQTWGNRNFYQTNHKMPSIDMKLLFLLGACKTEGESELLFEENLETKDIIQWDFFDSFQNLTVKECLFLQFVHNKCDGISHIFKGDDDIIVKVEG